MRRLIPILVVVAAFVASGCDSTTPYAAIVNGTRISRDQVDREVNGLASNAAFVTAYNQARQAATPPLPGVRATNTVTGTYTQSFVGIVLYTEIRGAVVHAEVMRRKIEPTAAAIADPATVTAAGQQFGTDLFAKFPQWVRTLFQTRQAEEDALGKALGVTAVTDAQVQQFYVDNPQFFIASQCVSHILLKTQADATAVVAQLQGGAPFAGLAAQASTDAATAAKGGDLGCDVPGQGTNAISTDQQFLAAATAAKVGTVSAPVQVAQGWDVFIVTKRTLSPLTAQLKQAIVTHIQQTAAQPLADFVAAQFKSQKIQVNPIYGHWDGTQAAVVPPNSPDPVRSGLSTVQTPTLPTTTIP